MLKQPWLYRAHVLNFSFGVFLKNGMFVKKIGNDKHDVSKPVFGLFCVAIDQFADSVTSRRNLGRTIRDLIYHLDTSIILLFCIRTLFNLFFLAV